MGPYTFMVHFVAWSFLVGSVSNKSVYFSRSMTKPTKWLVRLVKTSAQSDQSLRCPHEEALGPLLPTERIAKTLIRLGRRPSWSESLLSAHIILLILSCCGSFRFWISYALCYITISWFKSVHIQIFAGPWRYFIWVIPSWYNRERVHPLPQQYLCVGKTQVPFCIRADRQGEI